MEKKYNIYSAHEAYEHLKDIMILEDRFPMPPVDADTAFQTGFETALDHLRAMIGPDPREIEVHTYRVVELDDELVFPTTHPE
jgi:hypothetical protein